MLNIDKYLSVTWQMGGRAYPILDCYGLVLEVRRDMALPSWPSLDGIVSKPNDHEAMNEAAMCIKQHLSSCSPAAGAVAACFTSGLVTHLGIVIEADMQLMVMECNFRKNVTVLPLRRFEKLYSRVEYYR